MFTFIHNTRVCLSLTYIRVYQHYRGTIRPCKRHSAVHWSDMAGRRICLPRHRCLLFSLQLLLALLLLLLCIFVYVLVNTRYNSVSGCHEMSIKCRQKHIQAHASEKHFAKEMLRIRHGVNKWCIYERWTITVVAHILMLTSAFICCCSR